MKKLSSFLIILVLLISQTGCFSFDERITGNGKMETEERTLKNINAIKVLGSLDVEVLPGEPSVRVEADGNILPFIRTDVDNRVLKIGLKDDVSISTANDIKVYVTTPSLNSVTVAGSGNVVSKGDFDNDKKMTFRIAGSGNINMNVYTPRVEADIVASGNLKLLGETKDLNVKVAGSGNFEGNDLKAENAYVKIAGSGDVYLFADVKLDAKILGSGNVKYSGNPALHKNIRGSGSISKLP